MYEKNDFTTGDLVKMLGTTKNTLFYYDKIGLFCPAVIKENGYRAYSYLQLQQFLAIAYLRKIGMPLKEIQQYMEQRTPQRLETLLQSQLEQVQSQIDELAKIRYFLKSHLHQLRNLQDVDLNRISLVYEREQSLYCSPEIPSECSADGLILLGKFFAETVTSGLGAVMPMDRIQQGIYDHPRCFFSLTEEHLQGIGHIEQKPAGQFLVGYEKGMDLRYGYERMLEYARRHGWEMIGEGYEEYVVSELDVVDSREYVTRISLPVQPA